MAKATGKTKNGRTKGIKIDGVKLKKIIQDREDMSVASVGTDLGFSTSYLGNMLDRNTINTGMIKYLDKAYGIPFEAYEYKELEPEPEPERKVIDPPFPNIKMSESTEDTLKALMLYLGSDKNNHFDYERLWKIMKSAFKEAIEEASKEIADDIKNAVVEGIKEIL